MNNTKLFFVGLMLLCSINLTFSQEKVRIAKYKHNKSAAVSYTFDDGLRNQYLIAVPIMEKLNVTGTFFIIPGKTAETLEEAETKKRGDWGGITWDELCLLQSKGFEIGNHTYTHKNLVNNVKSDAEAEEEIEKSADLIEKKTGTFPISFCYPFNGRNEHVEKMVLKRHAVARNFQRGIGKHDVMSEALETWIDGLIVGKEWGVAMIHGLEDGFDPLSPAVFEEHLQYAKSQEADLWIDTFGNIGRYVEEVKTTQINILTSDDKSLTFSLDNALRKDLYNYPLTVIVQAPKAKKVKATINKKKVPVMISDDEIMIDCIPNGDVVTVKWK